MPLAAAPRDGSYTPMTGFILKIKEQIPKFSQTFFKDFYRLLPGKYLKRLQKEWFEKWYLD